VKENAQVPSPSEKGFRDEAIIRKKEKTDFVNKIKQAGIHTPTCPITLVKFLFS
jgi:hypothetical protein